MKRVMFEYDMFGGFVEIREPRMLHPDADELWTDHGEVPESVWDHYQSTVTAMREAFETVRMNLKPLDLSPVEIEEARKAHEAHQLEVQAMMDGFAKEKEETLAECPHTDEYGSLINDDGCCMVCGFRP